MAAAKNKFLTKRYIGFFLAIVVFLLIKFVLPLDSLGSVALSEGGKNCLALSLGAVVMWACGVAQPGYTGILYCALLVLMQVSPTPMACRAWPLPSPSHLVPGPRAPCGSSSVLTSSLVR